ncbi:MAG: hypothetical protein K1X94_04315 [Sandaracinaceae bacterium]|nr:hypothetical protein [Sandaracinaceae bacterium]
MTTLIAPACTTRGTMDLPDTGGLDGGPDAASIRFDTGPLPDSGAPLEDTLIYAHSPNTLYSFSAMTNTVTEIGRFMDMDGTFADDMVDLAVDAAGNVVTSSRDALYSVNVETGVVTQIGAFDVAMGEQFYALTFLAPGELGANETLIGATNMGVYYEIDPTDASVRRLGSYPDGWLSSGDLVSVEGATYATIRHMDDTVDTLAQITFDAAGHSTIRVIGPIRGGGMDFTQIFGLGYWGRSVYGFSNSGQLIEIDRTTGAGHLATTMTGTDRFWGAGVTTRAPVLL